MRPITRRIFMGAAGAAFAQPSFPPPNIVFILADDLGYGDLGCYGQRMIATANLDRLAAEGMRFTNAYAGSSVCAPSRCCLMTGLHTGHAQVRANAAPGGSRVPLREEDRTVAEILKQGGYRTALIGKWGLGEAGTVGIPTRKGFDEFFGYLNQDHALHYYPLHLWNNDTEFLPPGNQGAKRTQYAQDLLTDRALRFIDENRARPFFLYLAYTIPHADSERSRDTGDGYVVPDYEPYTNRAWPTPDKGYAAMIGRLDRDVGKLMDRLKGLGLDSNTVVFFASDNGPAVEGTHTPDFFRSAGQLRGHKGQLYEGGIRVPLIARWPGKIDAGTTCNQPVAFWDFLPTAADLAGRPIPQGLDGRSWKPLLEGRTVAAGEPLFWESYGASFDQAVRIGKWKGLSFDSGKKFELYDLESDPAEAAECGQTRPEVARKTREIMRRAHRPSPIYRPKRA